MVGRMQTLENTTTINQSVAKRLESDHNTKFNSITRNMNDHVKKLNNLIDENFQKFERYQQEQIMRAVRVEQMVSAISEQQEFKSLELRKELDAFEQVIAKQTGKIDDMQANLNATNKALKPKGIVGDGCGYKNITEFLNAMHTF